MTRIKPLALLILPLVLALAAPSPAQAAPPQTIQVLAPSGGAVPSAGFCAMVVAPVKDKTVDSKVVCSETSAADARAALPAAAAAKVRLMTYYPEAGWAGTPLDIWGTAGYCDEEGYPTLGLTDYWESHISSIRGYQTCNAVLGFSAGRSGAKTYYEHNLSWSFGATTFNDDMGSIKLYCNRSC